MSKSTIEYWNPLLAENQHKWCPIKGLEHVAEELTLAVDALTGDYTRLTRFKAGANTAAFGVKSHDYPEEIFVVAGSLYDAAFDRWLHAGDYASRPPGEPHGPFKTIDGCIVLEISFPSQVDHGDHKTDEL